MSEICACGTPFVRTEYQPEPHCPKCGGRPAMIDADDYYRRLRESSPYHQRDEMAKLVQELLPWATWWTKAFGGKVPDDMNDLVRRSRTALRRHACPANDDPEKRCLCTMHRAEPVMTGEPAS